MGKMRGAISVDIDKCKGCSLCVPACPTDVLLMSKEVNHKGYKYVYMENPEECTACKNCAILCPDGVISVYRIKIAS